MGHGNPFILAYSGAIGYSPGLSIPQIGGRMPRRIDRKPTATEAGRCEFPFIAGKNGGKTPRRRKIKEWRFWCRKSQKIICSVPDKDLV
jgi:hypothetical protein